MNRRRLLHLLRYPFSREERIKTGILNGRYTVNEGRRMLGLPEYREHFANRYIKVDQRGLWFLREG